VNLHTAWLTKEGCNEEPEDSQEDGHKPYIGRYCVNEEVDKQPYCQAYQTGSSDDYVTLFINLHIVLVLGYRFLF
jgi:hypothetical protein